MMHQITTFCAITSTAVVILTTDSFGLAFSFSARSACRGRGFKTATRTRLRDDAITIIRSIASTTSEENIADCSNNEHRVIEWQANKSSDDGTTNNDRNSHNFNAKAFASSKCWGRRPFLMRGAFDPKLLLDDGSGNCHTTNNDGDDDVDGEDEESIFAWPSWEEVVEIAADDDSESRIISHIPGDHSTFELQWGPLNQKDIRSWLTKAASKTSSNNERRETLVVNDMDRFYPPLADWMHDTFQFLPNWRMDDGQISLAEQGGGIGPHVDNYDVFLIQMSGTRTWQVGKRMVSHHEERDRTIDGLDVRVMDDWSLDDNDNNNDDDGGDDEQEMEEWTVYPGDLLYLPPRRAHCGTALSNDSMTLSVGCRAPSVSDLVSKLAERLSSSIEDFAVRRYTDDDLLSEGIDDDDDTHHQQSNEYFPGELRHEAKDHARDLLMDSFASTMNDDEWWDEFFGRYVTEQKRVRNNYPIPLDDLNDEFEDLPDEWKDAKSTVQSVLANKGVLYHAEGIAFAYSCVHSTIHPGRTSHRFFANGEMWQTESQSNGTDAGHGDMVRLFQTVSNHRRLDRTLLLGAYDDSGHSSIQHNELEPEAVQFLENLVSSGVLYGSEE